MAVEVLQVSVLTKVKTKLLALLISDPCFKLYSLFRLRIKQGYTQGEGPKDTPPIINLPEFMSNFYSN